MFRKRNKVSGPINNLPEETLHHIVSFASAKSQIQLRQTNTFFYAALTTTDFLKAHSDYSDRARDCLSHISIAALNGVHKYLSVNTDNILKSIGIRRAIFYEAVINHKDATPQIKAIAVFCLLNLEGGRELKKTIVKEISVDIKSSIIHMLDNPKVLDWNSIVKRFSMLSYHYSSAEFQVLAKKLFDMQQQPEIKDNIVARYGDELCDVYRYVNDHERLNKHLASLFDEFEHRVCKVSQLKR